MCSERDTAAVSGTLNPPSRHARCNSGVQSVRLLRREPAWLTRRPMCSERAARVASGTLKRSSCHARCNSGVQSVRLLRREPSPPNAAPYVQRACRQGGFGNPKATLPSRSLQYRNATAPDPVTLLQRTEQSHRRWRRTYPVRPTITATANRPTPRSLFAANREPRPAAKSACPCSSGSPATDRI